MFGKLKSKLVPKNRASKEAGSVMTTKKTLSAETAKSRVNEPNDGKLGYNERMMKKYKLTKDQLKKAKKEAHQQKENWIKYKKEQVLDIFGSKNQYVSKSASSDVKHPSAFRSVATVINREGKEIQIEFGKRLEMMLENVRPNPKFVIIKSQLSNEKSKNVMASKFKQRHKIKGNKDRSKDKKQMYDKMKSSIETGARTSGVESTVKQDDTNRSEASMSGKNDDDDINTTDASRKLFDKDWYALSSSRNLAKNKKGHIFWVLEEDDETHASDLEDEDDKNYSVTADVILEVLEKKKEVHDSKVEEPKEQGGFGEIAKLEAQYKKSKSRDIVFNNTLKGTIDFDAMGSTASKNSKGDEGKIEWIDSVEVNVFKGDYMERYIKKKVGVTNKSEKLEDIVRVQEKE